MTDLPFSFMDAEDGEWVRNGNGTYRSLDSDIRSMSYEDIKREFGIKPPPQEKESE
jgi:hypothetical protein